MQAHDISEFSSNAAYTAQPLEDKPLFGRKDDPETLSTAVSAEDVDNVPNELTFGGTGMECENAENQMQGSEENSNIAVTTTITIAAAAAASDNDPTTAISSITSAIKPPVVLTPTSNTADNDPVCTAHHADVSPVNMVAIDTLADDDPTTVVISTEAIYHMSIVQPSLQSYWKGGDP